MAEPAPRTYYDTRYHFAEDAERPNERRMWHAMREIAPLGGTDFLDLGCGAGWALRLARLHGVRHAVGLDFSATALELAHAHTPDASWVLGDDTTLPFADETFDRVYSHGSMEHFPDVPKGFHELYRVLRPGGLAVTVVPNFYIRTEQPLEFRATENGWRRVAESAGFRIVRVGTDRGPEIFKNRRVGRIAMRVTLRLLSFIPPLRYQFVIVLQKPAATVPTRA